MTTPEFNISPLHIAHEKRERQFRLPPATEAPASDAIESMARALGVPVDLDDPEPALVAAVARALRTALTQKLSATQTSPPSGAASIPSANT